MRNLNFALIGLVVALGCSKPALPERPSNKVSAKVPAVATDVAPASYVASAEPQPIRPLIAARPIEELKPAIRPYTEWSEQEVAADALGRIGPVAVPALRQALTNEDADVRLHAAEVLGRMGTDAKEAVPDLVRLLDDTDERVRKAAGRTLGRIGPEASDAVPALMRTLLTPEP